MEWALQVAVRAEKIDPPTHEEACEAAAMAVVRLIASQEWDEQVRAWEDSRIRKITRRARGIRWVQVQELPGLTVDHAGAQARAFPPSPMDEVPPEIAKLQVAGLELESGEPKPPPPGPYAEIVLNPQVTMSTGKAAAQASHAAHLLLRRLPAREREAWIAAGLEVRIGVVDWRRAQARATVAVRDAGFTEVAPGTMTALSYLAGSTTILA